LTGVKVGTLKDRRNGPVPGASNRITGSGQESKSGTVIWYRGTPMTKNDQIKAKHWSYGEINRGLASDGNEVEGAVSIVAFVTGIADCKQAKLRCFLGTSLSVAVL
jgi:hypothetical protein